MRLTDEQVEIFARARLNCAAASVTAYKERNPYRDRERNEDLWRVWFGLSIKQHDGDDWQLVGRRDSRQGLLEMIESKAAQATQAAGAIPGASCATVFSDGEA